MIGPEPEVATEFLRCSPVLESYLYGTPPETRYRPALSEQVGRMGPVRILLLGEFLVLFFQEGTLLDERRAAMA